MNGNAVRVVLWGETVGYLTWDSSDWCTATAVFRFADDFLERGLDISPLGMSVHSEAARSHSSIRGAIRKIVLGDCIRYLPIRFPTIGETASSADGRKRTESA